ncbi:MAG: shikimate dehydrogenase [Bosea sp. (in: a-proteobacteria)]
MVQRCFVAGFPIQQSRSPLIHSRWIMERGLDATYQRLEVRPEDLAALLADVRNGSYLGGNLTIPLKQAAVPLLDRISDDARAMGAVNTIHLQDGQLTGANTDVAGFLAHLDLTCPGWDVNPVSVLLLGAGGAARAIVHGLMTRNVGRLGVANRSIDRVAALLDQVRSHAGASVTTHHVAWPPRAEDLAACDIVINATSLGMKGQPPLDLVWPQRLSGTIAYDIVYVPLMTPFLAAAAARGGRVVDGLGMLLHQASLAFGHWFGDVPAVTPELRALIEADLASSAENI